MGSATRKYAQASSVAALYFGPQNTKLNEKRQYKRYTRYQDVFPLDARLVLAETHPYSPVRTFAVENSGIIHGCWDL